MRAVAVLAALLLLAGCGVRSVSGAPGPTVHVVQEDIHSGLLVPADWVWPQATGVAELSFGDAEWMMGHSRTSWRACRVTLWPSDGAFYLRRIGDDAASAIRSERWRAIPIALSPTGAAQMRTELARWMPPGPDLDSWTDGSVFRPGIGFHTFRNCHDQVAAALLAAGVPLSGSWLPWRTVDRFQSEVDGAVAALQVAGIAYVERAEDH